MAVEALGAPRRSWLRRALRPVATLTAAGRVVLVLAVAIQLAAARIGLADLRVVGVLCVTLLGCCTLWALSPVRVNATVAFSPPRAVVGEPVTVGVRVTNLLRWPALQPLVRIPVGEQVRWLRFANLWPRGTLDRSFVLSPERRGVIDLGPVVQHRGDPLGLILRKTPWTGPVELFVRPAMVHLETLGPVQVKDLDGDPSGLLSMSDLSFHDLREYTRGDDLRHVHWRSSASSGELVVRQYQESRSTRAAVLLDPAHGSYPDVESYELAVSVAASLVACAAISGHELSLISDEQQCFDLAPPDVLDALCRVGRGTGSLAADVAALLTRSTDTGLVLVVTGAGLDSAQMFAALRALDRSTQVGVIRAVPGAEPRMELHQTWWVRTCGALEDLPIQLALT